MSNRTPGQLLEEFIQVLNGNIFLREFAVSSGRLAVQQGEIEVADTMVLLRNLVLVYQLKERDPEADSSNAALNKWFDRKVSGQAVGQIADTLGYLKEHTGRVVTNDRGHEVALAVSDAGVIASLVIYRADAAPSFRGPKGCNSTRAGFVHFVEASDYFHLCGILRTPIEVAEYLSFRKSAQQGYGGSATKVSEKALVGQFLLDVSGPPAEKYREAFDLLVDLGEDDDLSLILQNLGDRVDYRVGDDSETSHYAILQELALLSRRSLTALKARLKLCVQTVRSGEFRQPTHFANPASSCGFLITPWDSGLGIPQADYLRTLTQLSKYTFGVRRQVGLSVSHHSDGYYILWCFIDTPHVDDPALDAALAAKGCPLPPTMSKSIPKYHFDTEGLKRLLSSDE